MYLLSCLRHKGSRCAGHDRASHVIQSWDCKAKPCTCCFAVWGLELHVLKARRALVRKPQPHATGLCMIRDRHIEGPG